MNPPYVCTVVVPAIVQFVQPMILQLREEILPPPPPIRAGQGRHAKACAFHDVIVALAAL